MTSLWVFTFMSIPTWIDTPSLFPAQSNTTYVVASGASKLFALAITYPYQVVRARIQVRTPSTILIRLLENPNLTSYFSPITTQHRTEQRDRAPISHHPHVHHADVL